MSKKRILFCGESHKINSGFGRYTKEVLQRLHDSGKYVVAEFGSYIDETYKQDVPWKVYPNAVKEQHKLYNEYKANPINQFGQWRFEKVVLHFRPDIVFDIRDYWMFSYQEVSPLRKYFNWVIGPTIDSIPQKTEWLSTFQNADAVVTHTDWAANYLKSLNRPINVLGTVSDSVDTNCFKPISWSKSYHKVKNGLPADSIIIGSVMRNQKRKLIAELFCSLREIINKTGNENIFLYLHTSFPEPSGWNIPELLQEYNVYNNVIFTYYSPINNKYCCSLYKGPKILSEEENVYYIFPNVIHGVSNDQLCEIYNLFDVYVQYAICEGLGIPQLEATSCGIPLFAVNYSGMEEILNKVGGQPIDCVLVKELETGSNRAYPINNDFIEKIISWIKLDKKSKKELSKNIRNLLIANYSWDKTTKNIMDIFDSIEPKNNWDEPMQTNTSINVPDNLSNRDFINFIVDNILCEPNFKNTFFIQNYIKNMDENISSDPIKLKQSAIKTLEIFLNNKIYCEKIRSGQIDISAEDYLNCNG